MDQRRPFAKYIVIFIACRKANVEAVVKIQSQPCAVHCIFDFCGQRFKYRAFGVSEPYFKLDIAVDLRRVEPFAEPEHTAVFKRIGLGDRDIFAFALYE